MALRANSLYGYTDLSDDQVFVKTTDLNDLGTWSGAVSYVFRDAALYNGAYYVCLTANTNTAPDGNISDYWSVLALVREGNPSHTADEAYELAEEALDTAIEVGQQGSHYSFELFVAGTDYTNTQAISAIGTAIQQGSEFAYNLFTTGTSYTNSLFTAGTDYTDSAVQVAAQEGSQFSTILRDQGTNYTNDQIAIVENSGSEFAVILRDQGTNYAITQDTVVAQHGSQLGFILRDQGTNYTNDQVAVAVFNGSVYALSLFSAGTDSSNSIELADAGTTGDGVGLATPRSGSDLPIKRLKSGQNIEIVSTGSNAEISVQAVDTNTIQWSGPSVGQVAAMTYAGTVTLDFAGQSYSILDMTGDAHITAINFAIGRGVSVLLRADGTDRTVTSTSEFKFIGAAPSSVLANKVAVLSLTSFGTTVDDVIGAFAAQQ